MYEKKMIFATILRIFIRKSCIFRRLALFLWLFERNFCEKSAKQRKMRRLLVNPKTVVISKPKKRQQTLRVPMQTSNCLFVNKLTTITYMFPSNLINHIAVLQKNTKKCQKIIKFLSMSKMTKNDLKIFIL